jgi:hypothetical protein
MDLNLKSRCVWFGALVAIALMCMSMSMMSAFATESESDSDSDSVGSGYESWSSTNDGASGQIVYNGVTYGYDLTWNIIPGRGITISGSAVRFDGGTTPGHMKSAVKQAILSRHGLSYSSVVVDSFWVQ